MNVVKLTIRYIAKCHQLGGKRYSVLCRLLDIICAVRLDVIMDRGQRLGISVASGSRIPPVRCDPPGFSPAEALETESRRVNDARLPCTGGLRTVAKKVESGEIGPLTAPGP